MIRSPSETRRDKWVGFDSTWSSLWGVQLRSASLIWIWDAQRSQMPLQLRVTSPRRRQIPATMSRRLRSSRQWCTLFCLLQLKCFLSMGPGDVLPQTFVSFQGDIYLTRNCKWMDDLHKISVWDWSFNKKGCKKICVFRFSWGFFTVLTRCFKLCMSSPQPEPDWEELDKEKAVEPFCPETCIKRPSSGSCGLHGTFFVFILLQNRNSYLRRQSHKETLPRVGNADQYKSKHG